MWRIVLVVLTLIQAPVQAAETADSELLARLAELEQTSVLFLSQEDRRIAFRNMARLSPSRFIEAGDAVYPLRKTPVDFEGASYEVAGESYRLPDYLQNPAHVGLIVVRDGDILLEEYSSGNDENSVWVSFSVTKSVTSMLIGAAIQDGFIKSVDEAVVDYLPRLRGTSYEHASIRNVLNMASGVSWNEDYADPASDVAQAGAANGLLLANYLGGLPGGDEPGEVFNYNTGETNLVGEILRAAIGNNATTYLVHKIWQPFGMEFDAWWSLGRAGGAELGGCCISASLRDYARLGIFAMNGGRLRDGARVLPEGWMDESTRPSKGYEGYGYLWWLFDDGSYAARGIFGQLIHIFPEDGLVVAAHGNAEAATGTEFHAHQQAAVQAIRDYLADDSR